MASRFRTWWQKIKQHPFVTMIILLIIALLAFALAVHWLGWGWTGFTGYSPPTPQYQRGKTLWDWLQLLVVPLVLALGGFWLSQVQKTTEKRSTTDNQQAAALQAYIDKMSELLLKEHLGERTADGELQPDYEQVRNVARVRTITLLTQLDARRISYVFAFLREAGLMSTKSDDNVVSLSNADLRRVNWSQADLWWVNLSKANLEEANLSGVGLFEANLSEANLNKANLSGVGLFEANLSGAKLNKANLRGADLKEAELSEADLSGANLSGANLRGAILEGAGLEGANLSGADLSKANLINAKLSGANLSGVNLRGADLTVADLTGADLTGADLYKGYLYYQGTRIDMASEAKVTESQLKQAKSLKGATMPDGSKHP